MMIDIKKEYTTKDGSEVKLIGPGAQKNSICGAYKGGYDDVWYCALWDIDTGKRLDFHNTGTWLVEKKKTFDVDKWLIIYDQEARSSTHPTKEEAQRFINVYQIKAFALIHVKQTVTEGEGLV